MVQAVVCAVASQFMNLWVEIINLMELIDEEIFIKLHVADNLRLGYF